MSLSMFAITNARAPSYDRAQLPATTARCSGTFGELVQGRIGGRCFLVTLPINLYAFAAFHPDYVSRVRLGSNHQKVECFIDALSVELGHPIKGQLRLSSMIPRGKGLASSSADLVAAGTAVLGAYGVAPSLHARMIARASGRVEPTDGVMYPGIVSFAQHNSQLIESFGHMDLNIIGCLLPGDIDTCVYDSSRIRYSSRELRLFEEAYTLVRRAFEQKDRSLLGMAASISAEINQRFLPKPQFDEVKKIAHATKAAGIVVAHSGTAIGLIAPNAATPRQMETMADALSQLYGMNADHFQTSLAGPTHRIVSRKAINQ
jgi:uncharacterized protein involved in propanediol utilization